MSHVTQTSIISDTSSCACLMNALLSNVGFLRVSHTHAHTHTRTCTRTHVPSLINLGFQTPRNAYIAL